MKIISDSILLNTVLITKISIVISKYYFIYIPMLSNISGGNI